MVKATYLTASKREKVALLIILFQSLMWSHNAATISSFHFYGLITYSLIFQPTVRDFSAWHKSILCIFLISCHSYSLQSCHQLMLDSGASNYIQTPPSSSWSWQYLHDTPSISNETFSSYPWKRSEELPFLLTVFIDISILFTSCTSHPHILFKVIFHCWIVFIFLDTHWSASSHPVFLFYKTHLFCSIFKGLWKMHSPRLPVPRSHTRSLSLCTCNGKVAGTWSRSFCHISEPVKKERLFWKLVLNRRL